MGGPAIGIIYPFELNNNYQSKALEIIKGLAVSIHPEEEECHLPNPSSSTFAGPIYYSFEMEPGWLEEALDNKLSKFVGWTPQYVHALAIGSKGREQNLALAKVTSALAGEFGGIVDFNGDLLPPIEGQLEQLFHNYRAMMYGDRGEDHDSSGPGTAWSDWQPYFDEMIRDIPGRLYTVPCTLYCGTQWVHHYGDATFLKHWMEHEHFYLIK